MTTYKIHFERAGENGKIGMTAASVLRDAIRLPFNQGVKDDTQKITIQGKLPDGLEDSPVVYDASFTTEDDAKATAVLSDTAAIAGALEKKGVKGVTVTYDAATHTLTATAPAFATPAL